MHCELCRIYFSAPSNLCLYMQGPFGSLKRSEVTDKDLQYIGLCKVLLKATARIFSRAVPFDLCEPPNPAAWNGEGMPLCFANWL